LTRILAFSPYFKLSSLCRWLFSWDKLGVLVQNGGGSEDVEVRAKKILCALIKAQSIKDKIKLG